MWTYQNTCIELVKNRRSSDSFGVWGKYYSVSLTVMSMSSEVCISIETTP